MSPSSESPVRPRKRTSSDDWETPGRSRRKLIPVLSTPSPSPPSASRRRLRRKTSPADRDDDSDEYTPESIPTPSTAPITGTRSSTASAQPATVVTPLVHEIVAPFFPETAFSVEGPQRKQPSKQGVRPLPTASESVADCDESDFLQEGAIWFDRKRVNVRLYKRVCVDGESYTPGDFVAVQPGHDDQHPRAALYASAVGDSPWADLWYARIIYVFKNQGQLYVHVRWLEHGCKIPLLMEVAHPNALFVLTAPEASCADIEAESILHKAIVKVLHPVDPEPSIGELPLHEFFVKYTWSPTTAAFEDASPQLSTGDGIDEHRGCFSCASDAKDTEVAYHINDFVYFQSRQPASANQMPAYRLGQIVAFVSEKKVKLRLLGRWDNVMHALKKCVGQKHFDKSLAKDETRLFLMTATCTVERERLARKFFVHSEAGCEADSKEWFALEDHFWMDLRATKHPVESLDDLVPIADHTVEQCTKCVEEEATRIRHWRHFITATENEPLRGLELFSGCGGLATAFEEVSCRTSWAVERDESAALTLSKMHPHCVVHTADVNDALRTIIRSGSAKGFPAQGEDIGILFGGPPCQGFSTLNRNRRAGDERNLLFANMLSWVDVYRPTYFLLENVGGMLSFQLQSVAKDRPTVEVEFGTVKLIVRVLAALGYQVRVHYLQAGMYGAPQSRHRLVILGSRIGTELPIAPHATHAFQGRTKATKKLPGGLQLLLRPEPGCAFQGVSLGDAIGDLPAFNWDNPHIVIGASTIELAKKKARAKHMPAFTVYSKGSVGFTNAVNYRRHALTSFQHRCRGDQQQVTQQHTRTFGPTQVERVCNVPPRPGACHYDLPKRLSLSKQDGQHANKPYSRLDFAVPAPIASTQMELGGASGQVLHPTQYRCLTVREFARIQGFPDWYEFHTTTGKLQECYKQIGNAVPLALGMALARAVQKSRFVDWTKEQTRQDRSSSGLMDSVVSPKHNRARSARVRLDVVVTALDAKEKAAYTLTPLSQQRIGSSPQAEHVTLSPLPAAVPPSSSSGTLVSISQDPQHPPRRRLHVYVDLPMLDAETRRLYHSHI